MKKAKVTDIYLMTERKARAKKLSTIGASWSLGLVIIQVRYESGGIQSTALRPGKTSLSIKKGDKVEVESDRYITAIKAQGRKLKSGWGF
jgi:hypothetical protein